MSISNIIDEIKKLESERDAATAAQADWFRTELVAASERVSELNGKVEAVEKEINAKNARIAELFELGVERAQNIYELEDKLADCERRLADADIPRLKDCEDAWLQVFRELKKTGDADGGTGLEKALNLIKSLREKLTDAERRLETVLAAFTEEDGSRMTAEELAEFAHEYLHAHEVLCHADKRYEEVKALREKLAAVINCAETVMGKLSEQYFNTEQFTAPLRLAIANPPAAAQNLLDELARRQSLIDELGRDLLERQRLQSVQAGEMGRLHGVVERIANDTEHYPSTVGLYLYREWCRKALADKGDADGK